MPERGPAQLLLLSFSTLKRSGWRVGLAASLVALLGLLPREEGVYHHAKADFAQSLRQAAWNHAIAGEQTRPAWPWDEAAPVAYSKVPRLGLSATIQHDAAASAGEANTNELRRKLAADDWRDPHLGDVAIGDLPETDEGLTEADQVKQALGMPGESLPVIGPSDPHLSSPRTRCLARRGASPHHRDRQARQAREPGDERPAEALTLYCCFFFFGAVLCAGGAGSAGGAAAAASAGAADGAAPAGA